MTSRDRWKKRPSVLRYYAFRDEVRLLAGSWKPPEDGSSIVFRIPMPRSWSKKKRAEMDGKPHKQTPDLSNLLKAFEDCWPNDERISSYGALSKVWAERGEIEIG